MKKLFLTFFMITGLFCGGFAQQTREPSAQTSLKLLLVPATLATLGVIIETLPSGSELGKIRMQQHFGPGAGHMHNHGDDYLEFAPAGAALLLPLILKTPHKSETGEFLAKSAVSHVLSFGILESMKRGFDHERPDGGRYSFPSGHTTVAFLGAQILFLEYKDTNKWLAYGAYPVAVFVGIDRAINNRHWYSDIFVGAALGMAVPTLVYWAKDKLFPARSAAERQEAHYSAYLTPSLGRQSQGLSLVVNF
ncbi:MAG: phosphatase PAP2 family protein [Elusimicrobiota bacterium]|jgi:hypothetical protein|nr:phosphatase PAP2 family protein [Elusimicrobiota bacterium]